MAHPRPAPGQVGIFVLEQEINYICQKIVYKLWAILF